MHMHMCMHMCMCTCACACPGSSKRRPQRYPSIVYLLYCHRTQPVAVSGVSAQYCSQRPRAGMAGYGFIMHKDPPDDKNKTVRHSTVA